MPYIYLADLYCDKCGEAILDDIHTNRPLSVPPNPSDESSYDSDQYPKYASGDDESDCPEHCCCGPYCIAAEVMPSGRKVGYFFMNALTSDGEDYVVEKYLQNPANEVALMWFDHYASQGYSKVEEVKKMSDDLLEFLLAD